MPQSIGTTPLFSGFTRLNYFHVECVRIFVNISIKPKVSFSPKNSGHTREKSLENCRYFRAGQAAFLVSDYSDLRGGHPAGSRPVLHAWKFLYAPPLRVLD